VQFQRLFCFLYNYGHVVITTMVLTSRFVSPCLAFCNMFSPWPKKDKYLTCKKHELFNNILCLRKVIFCSNINKRTPNMDCLETSCYSRLTYTNRLQTCQWASLITLTYSYGHVLNMFSFILSLNFWDQTPVVWSYAFRAVLSNPFSIYP